MPLTPDPYEVDENAPDRGRQSLMAEGELNETNPQEGTL